MFAVNGKSALVLQQLYTRAFGWVGVVTYINDLPPPMSHKNRKSLSFAGESVQAWDIHCPQCDSGGSVHPH